MLKENVVKITQSVYLSKTLDKILDNPNKCICKLVDSSFLQ